MSMRQFDVAQTVDDEAIATALAPWLDDLESRLDPIDEDRLLKEWKDFAAGCHGEAVFSPRRSRASPPQIDWPTLGIDDAIHDPQRMVLRQLKGCSDRLASGDGGLLCVRSDYGTGILPSMFCVPVVCMAREADTLPGTTPLGRDAMESLVAAGVPGLQSGLWPLVRSLGQAFVTCLRGRPGLQRHLHIYHPDLQGPMDVLEMLWGSACFTAFVEETELVHAVLRLISATYINAMADWDAIVPDRDPGWCAHWGLLHRGHIMLRDDSAMNLSPRMFRDLCAPYDGELLQRLGGGAMHACGRVGHFLAEATALPGMHAFNFGQPELNEAVRIQQATVDRGVHIIGLGRRSFDVLCAAGFQPRGLVHVQ
jgi:hypothetical protein